jgi:ribosomal RNA-processing protein 7
MDLCNATMTSYEQSEAEASARAKRLAEEPDEDGFITVTHNSSAPSFGGDDLESTQHQIGRGKGSKRNRKRKAENRHGGGEFSDFYKFQWKEKKKREMNDLKARFEEDLEKVKRMKEERAFRPF